MAKACSVCTHTNRDEIDKAIITGITVRELAGQWDISKSAIDRHKHLHLPKRLAQATETKRKSRVSRPDPVAALVEERAAGEMLSTGALFGHAQHLLSEALTILEQSKAAGDRKTALSAIREASNSLALFAKVSGLLKEGGISNHFDLRTQAIQFNLSQLSPDELRAIASRGGRVVNEIGRDKPLEFIQTANSDK